MATGHMMKAAGPLTGTYTRTSSTSTGKVVVHLYYLWVVATSLLLLPTGTTSTTSTTITQVVVLG
jgi:hypothetical protein